MKLTEQDVKKIANLSRLKIEKSLVDEYINDLNDIIKFVEQMQTVNTDEVEPLSNPNGETQRLRDDKVTEGDARDVYQKIAPKVDKGLYLVPKVIE